MDGSADDLAAVLDGLDQRKLLTSPLRESAGTPPPLVVAAFNGHEAVVRLILARLLGQQPSKGDDESLELALTLASHMGQLSVVRALVEDGYGDT
jgi:hypothetical protein